MKLLDRYILRLFLGSLLSTTLFLVGLYLVLHFLAHVKHHDDARETFAAAGMGLWQGLCLYYWLHLPEILVLFGPYALLFASIFTLHHLEQGNELIPMRAVGLGRLRLTMPLFLGTAAIVLGLVVLKEAVIPGQARDMVVTSRLMRGKSDPVYDKIDLLADSKGNVFHAEFWDGGRLRLEDVDMLTKDGTQPLHFEYLEWVEENSGRGQFRPSEESGLTSKDFAAISDLEPYDIGEENRVLKRLSWLDLQGIKNRARDDQRLSMIKAEHLSYPASAFVLLLMGVPIVLRGRNKSIFAGILLCLGLSLTFFSATLLMSRLGAQSDFVSPSLAAWLPSLFGASIGLLLLEATRQS